MRYVPLLFLVCRWGNQCWEQFINLSSSTSTEWWKQDLKYRQADYKACCSGCSKLPKSLFKLGLHWQKPNTYPRKVAICSALLRPHSTGMGCSGLGIKLLGHWQLRTWRAMHIHTIPPPAVLADPQSHWAWPLTSLRLWLSEPSSVSQPNSCFPGPQLCCLPRPSEMSLLSYWSHSCRHAQPPYPLLPPHPAEGQVRFNPTVLFFVGIGAWVSVRSKIGKYNTIDWGHNQVTVTILSWPSALQQCPSTHQLCLHFPMASSVLVPSQQIPSP